MIKSIPKAILWAWFVMSFSGLIANAIQVENVQRLGAPNRSDIAFELSWQNSWNVAATPGNHDAV